MCWELWRCKRVRVSYFWNILCASVELFHVNTILHARLTTSHNLPNWSIMSDQFKTTRSMGGNKQVTAWKKLSIIVFSMGKGSRRRRKQDCVSCSSSHTLGRTDMTRRACFPFLFPSHTDYPRKKMKQNMPHNKFSCISEIEQYHIRGSNLIGNCGQGRELMLTNSSLKLNSQTQVSNSD